MPAHAAQSDADAESAPEKRRRHVLVQATIPPIDEDGRTAGIVGSLLFAIAAVIVQIVHTFRADAVPYWFLWVTLTGLGLGLMYLAYCHLRHFDASQHLPR